MARSALEGASLLYLALPWFVFAVGWLRPPWAACVVATLVLIGLMEIRRPRRPPELIGGGRRLAQGAALVALAVAWTALSGAGGVGFQNIDWQKHNLLLANLVEQRWPVDYVVVQQEGSRALPLTYYVAYYLPSAVNEIARSVLSYRWSTPENRPGAAVVTNPIFRVYVGDGGAWFFRHLARPLRQVVTIEAERPRLVAGGARVRPDGAASDGRVLVVDAGGEIELAYGVELEHSIREGILAVRYRTARPTALAVAVDGAPLVELSLPADPALWRFADTSIATRLDGGRHELTVRTRAPGTEIDAFVLIEAAH